MTTAFVLSGGGSLGAVQVGMLRALAERGIAPDLLVGTSAGALNAVFVIRVLYLVDGPSDAVTMARLFLLPAWLWATAWMLLAVGMLAATLWKTRR